MESIIKLILESFNLDNPLKTKEFLDFLKNGNEFKQRLLICLGIDTKAGLLDKDVMSSVLNSLDYESCLNSENILISYEDTIIRLGAVLSKVYKSPRSHSVRLARVMKSSIYSLYFYPKTVGIFDVNPDWRNIKREIERGNLESVNMPNSALKPRCLVWCTPLNDLEEIINNFDSLSLNSANEIVDRLGLCANATVNNEYVYIEYHESFNETIYQPCNLSNSWIDETSLYISCITNDGFGRTRPRKGDDENRQMKEVVHNSIDNPDIFIGTIKYLGNVTDFPIDTTEFNNEAMKRYTI